MKKPLKIGLVVANPKGLQSGRGFLSGAVRVKAGVASAFTKDVVIEKGVSDVVDKVKDLVK